jgi:predicted kinase
MLIVMMMGRTAAGKTTLARFLSKRLGARHVSEAALKRALILDYQVADSLDEALRDLGYAAAAAVARQCLLRSESVIVDAAYHRRQRRQELFDATALPLRQLVAIYCACSEIDETRRRIEARQLATPSPFTQANSFDVYRHINGTFEEVAIDEIKEVAPSAIVSFDSWTNSWSIDSNNLPSATYLELSAALEDYVRLAVKGAPRGATC